MTGVPSEILILVLTVPETPISDQDILTACPSRRGEIALESSGRAIPHKADPGVR